MQSDPQLYLSDRYIAYRQQYLNIPVQVFSLRPSELASLQQHLRFGWRRSRMLNATI